ncbi:putative selenate reductase subunit YgfK [Pelagibaculum spongiae]|uniref:dihydrouracil dehydrogenase (NAD(+)) n=1 Tax=Pelagibaculum spongiae TaxID=2080658 RepID=A0A2V1H182_9GAMM|nr:putative selenate reductase subunit YgfK [Pelagibaculum spongiae]PVZ71720.1 putative selenate reductase subunit YgfK [Pelagibaculum spongiae]
MADIMRPVPFKSLIERIVGEYRQTNSIFGIPAKQFFRKQNAHHIKVFEERAETPVGPAAGPHTQLTQNILTSWLTGGRFIELKTVQIMDELEIEKPCIDPEDECFNTEWSSEFTLTKAHDEYLKAWFLTYLLEELFDPQPDGKRSFIFNMSVGYNLEGIKTDRMQTFIDDMMDSAAHPMFAVYKAQLQALVNDEDFIKLMGLQGEAERIQRLRELPSRIPGGISQSMTLSTMHGCPPAEIEAICNYMLTEKKINTFVKLNPTLLGFKTVRGILDGCGFDYIGLNPEGFEHDLKIEQALPMLHRLVANGKEHGRRFGVKLTNTLASINHKGRLPGPEMYMSGRALYPLTMNVAALLAREFNGELPMSYSGGAWKGNINEIFDTGIRPITMATDLLKPGGYLRLKDCADRLETSDAWGMTKVDVDAVEALAKASLVDDYTQKEWHENQRKKPVKVPLTDCSMAPCKQACPIEQDIPEYMQMLAAGKYREALELVYSRNALPAITAHICDHQCMYACTRQDYEGSVKIREMKKIAVEKGWKEFRGSWQKPEITRQEKCAVIGAGPAGLAAALFMARGGFPVTLFEKEANAGGIVKNVIPQFRIAAEVIEQDIQFIADNGVNFEFGCDPELTVDGLKAQGFKYVFVGTGAEKGSAIPLTGDGAQGDTSKVIKSLSFLRQFNMDKTALQLGAHVAVVGGGNTAMDSARAALRLPGVEQVTVLYRRTEKEMPADREEYEMAKADGVTFCFLTNPESISPESMSAGSKGESGEGSCELVARVMELGEPDEQGRRRPVKTDKTVTLQINTLISAIGERPDCAALEAKGIALAEDGWPVVDSKTCETAAENVFLMGDAFTGPSSIVSAIGCARKAVDCALEREGTSLEVLEREERTSIDEIFDRKGAIPLKLVEEGDEGFIAQEASRCLECNSVCSKCVDVCPNRANMAFPIPGFKDPLQIIHIDAYCNECGNCGQFCNWMSRPYKEKFTLFSLMEDYRDSTNFGFLVDGEKVLVRVESGEFELGHKNGLLVGDSIVELGDELRIINYLMSNHSHLLNEVLL